MKVETEHYRRLQSELVMVNFKMFFSFHITRPPLLALHQVILIVLLLFALYRAKEEQWEQFIGSKS